jgi:uncharacterized integral membrane protein (TIGR00697 family)
MTLHSSLLVTSTIAGSKIFALPLGFSASATVLSYMLTFVILDTIAELYGRQYSRFVITLGLAGMALSAIYFEFAIWLPPAAIWKDQRALESILGSSWRIWLGGWTAYIVSQNVDLWSFLKLKQLPLGRASLAFRAWVSMLVGQLFDTIIFLTIAFYGTLPVGSVIVGQYLIKVIIATITTPFVSLAVAFGRNFVGDGHFNANLIQEKRPYF